MVASTMLSTGHCRCGNCRRHEATNRSSTSTTRSPRRRGTPRSPVPARGWWRRGASRCQQQGGEHPSDGYLTSPAARPCHVPHATTLDIRHCRLWRSMCAAALHPVLITAWRRKACTSVSPCTSHTRAVRALAWCAATPRGGRANLCHVVDDHVLDALLVETAATART